MVSESVRRAILSNPGISKAIANPQVQVVLEEVGVHLVVMKLFVEDKECLFKQHNQEMLS